MLAAHPLISIWDDHETANNSWTGGAENHQPDTEGSWDERRRAALQAYYEWMPVREPQPGRPREALFRAYRFGDLASLSALETRLMARDEQLIYSDIVPGLQTPEDIERLRRDVLNDPARQMLGEAQLAYFEAELKAAKRDGAVWSLLANQIIMANVIAPDLTPHVSEDDIVELEKDWDQARAFVAFSRLGLPTNLDAWDGYPAARERLYDIARSAGARDLLVVTGDTHTWWANDLYAANGDKMGVEFGVSSVTSPSPYAPSFLGGRGADYALLTNRDNPAVRYLSGATHGYIDLTLTPEAADARFVAVDTILEPTYQPLLEAGFKVKRRDGTLAFADTDGLGLRERWVF